MQLPLTIECAAAAVSDPYVTGSCPPATQPDGFAAGLELKQHQLESLALMQAAEERPLGFSNLVWQEVQLEGRSWWLSLVTGKITSSRPIKQPTGGILGRFPMRVQGRGAIMFFI